MTLTKLAFVTDVDFSNSKEKFDCTVQTDNVKSWIVSSKVDETGTVNGYVTDNDAQQQAIMKKVATVIEHTTSGGITRTAPETTVTHFMLSLNESTAAGAQHWHYIPAHVDSWSGGKPMEGVEPFTLNYSANGADKPSHYIRDN